MVNNVWKSYDSSETSFIAARKQLAFYKNLERKKYIKIISDLYTLDFHIENLNKNDESTKIGCILSMEGADAIKKPEDLTYWWKDGLRVLSLTHYGSNVYACGTGYKGGVTKEGIKLLEKMSSLGMILDVTHLSEQSFWEVMDVFDGYIIGSHSNCRSLVPGDRQLSDNQLKEVIRRYGVVGVCLDNWMLYPDWIKGKTSNKTVSLEDLLNHIDHICSMSGNSKNVAIGSDLDGGFGKEQCPHDLDTIADLQKIPNLLRSRDFHEEDIKNIMFGNWTRFFKKSL
jgi:membrane dipeptidase